LQLTFADGDATEQITPQPPVRADRVPVTDADRRGIADPLSAMLIPTKFGGGVLAASDCNRTLKIFDGRRRYNLALSYNRMDKVAIERGYSRTDPGLRRRSATDRGLPCRQHDGQIHRRPARHGTLVRADCRYIDHGARPRVDADTDRDAEDSSRSIRGGRIAAHTSAGRDIALAAAALAHIMLMLATS
jgi:Protein of unknown function (DUF3108).